MNRSGFIAIIGKPNVGKSTLLNSLLGEKIAIVSQKPQTTRTRITGVLTRDETQYIFLDTPGIHNPKNALGGFMVKSAYSSIGGVNCVLFVTEAEGKPDKTEIAIIDKLKKQKAPVYLILNKCDAISKEKVGEAILNYSPLMTFEDVIPISALKNDGLDIILDGVKKYMTEENWFFPPDMVTDQPERQIAAEVIREKILRLTDEEIPHGCAVVIEDFKEKSKIVEIRAEIFCERPSHKGIIIGKNGEMLKKIGSAARQELEEFFGVQVYINLWVKVKPNWRDNTALFRNFGYSED